MNQAPPFQRRWHQRFSGSLGCPSKDQLGLVQPVDRLGPRVVVAADRELNAHLGESLGVANS